METKSIQRVEGTEISSRIVENLLRIFDFLNVITKRIIARIVACLPIVGSSLVVLGALLSTGAETVAAALLSCSVLLLGAALLYVAGEKGGEA